MGGGEGISGSSDDLRRELLALEADDDRVRARLAADGSLFGGYHAEMEAVHRRNARRLREIIAASGWPGRSRVGEDGASAAWRIVQHAIGEPDFVRECLPLLEDAAARGEADAAQVAMLVDRVRCLEGRPQRYGTQLEWNDDATAMVPSGTIEDEAFVDSRRESVGLPPIRWMVPPDPLEPRPKDVKRLRAEMNAWAERVGWRAP